VQLQLLQLAFFVLVWTFSWLWFGLSLVYGLEFLSVMVWTFCLVFGYSCLVHYPWRKVHWSWLAIGLLPESLCMSRLRCLGVAFVPMVG
jgi:hypothetical protein